MEFNREQSLLCRMGMMHRMLDHSFGGSLPIMHCPFSLEPAPF